MNKNFSTLTGHKFEKCVSLNDYFKIQKLITKPIKYKIIVFDGCAEEFIFLEKSWFRKFMIYNGFVNNCLKFGLAHGCKEPDEAYIKDNYIFIIEKKFQEKGGSVVEKLQTVVYKRDHYNILYPNHEVILIYCLSKWFETNCKAEIKFLDDSEIPYFFVSENNWQLLLINFIKLSIK